MSHYYQLLFWILECGWTFLSQIISIIYLYIIDTYIIFGSYYISGLTEPIISPPVGSLTHYLNQINMIGLGFITMLLGTFSFTWSIYFPNGYKLLHIGKFQFYFTLKILFCEQHSSWSLPIYSVLLAVKMERQVTQHTEQ